MDEERSASSLRGKKARTSARATTVAFRDGGLPGICVVTGEPADDWWERTAKSRIGAQWLLLLVGILPFVLVRVLTVKQTHGYLPIARTEAAARRNAAKAARRRLLLRPLAMLILVAVAIGGATAGWSLFQARGQATDAVDTDRESYADLKGQIGDPVDDDDYQDTDLLEKTHYLLSEDGCIYSRERYQSYTTSMDGTSTPDGTWTSSTIWSCNPTTGITLDFPDAGNLTKRVDRPEDKPLVAAAGGTDLSDLDSDDYTYALERVEVNLVSVAMFGALAGASVALFGLFAVVLPLAKRKARAAVGGYYPRPNLALDRTGERLVVRNAHPSFAAAVARTAGPAAPFMPPIPVAPVGPGMPVGPPALPYGPPVPPAVTSVPVAPPVAATPAVPADPPASPQSAGLRGTLAKKSPPSRPAGQ